MAKNDFYEIGQTYIRLEVNASSYFKESFEKYLLHKGHIYSQEFYSKELISEKIFFKVELEEGSLKSRLKFFGKIAIGALATYAGIRAGLDFVIQDSKRISEHIIQDVRDEPNIDPSTILRVERRLGVPGKLRRFYNSIERLRTGRDDLTPNQQQQLINRIQNQYIDLVEELDESEIDFLDQELQTSNIPINRQLPTGQLDYQRLHLVGVREEEIQLINEENIEPVFRLPPPN